MFLGTYLGAYSADFFFCESLHSVLQQINLDAVLHPA